MSINRMTRDMDNRSQDPISLVYTVNRAFVDFAAVSVLSVVRSQHQPCHFYFVHDGDLCEATQTRLRVLAERHGARAEFQRVHDEFPRQLSQHTTWSVSVLFRLALTKILPPELNRVIYLDGDTLVRRSLDELMSMPLGESGLGAVPEPHEAIARLGLPLESAYLNSGVLAIELDQWRRNHTSDRLLQLAIETPERWHYPDQDIMAAHFQGNWTRLPPEYNVNHRFFQGPSSLPMPTENPHVVHFSGQGCKPWETYREHPFANEFWAIAELAREQGFTIPHRPQKKRRWYQRGPIAAYRQHRQRRRSLRRTAAATQRQSVRAERQHMQRRLVARYAPGMTVLRGPFAGIKYPQAYSHGSTLAPKLLGTYEAELHDVFTRLADKDYRVIIDIGAAEGYYAIGAALRWPEARIIAFELQREAREAIREMAIANGVADRVEVVAECMFGDLYKQRALIICDIEGSEAELLVSDHAQAGFANADFIVETHDLMRPGVCQRLLAQFSTTHDVSAIDTVADEDRLSRWPVPEVAHLRVAEQIEVISERRGGPMQWLVCESKHAFPLRQRDSNSAIRRAA